MTRKLSAPQFLSASILIAIFQVKLVSRSSFNFLSSLLVEWHCLSPKVNNGHTNQQHGHSVALHYSLSVTELLM